jgi:hypothetical protein
MAESNREKSDASLNKKGTSEPDDPVQTDSPQAIEKGGRNGETDVDRDAQVNRAKETQRKERARATAGEGLTKFPAD